MPHQTITLTQLLARLSQRTESATFWSTTSAVFALQEAVRLFNLITGTSRTTVLVNTVPDTPYIDLPAPTQCLKITRVRLTATLHELNPASLAGLDAAFPGWEAHTTLTARVSTVPRYWAPAGIGRLVAYPADATVLAGGNGPRALSVDLIACANIPVAATDFLDLDDAEVDALVGYALHVLSFSKGAAALAATRPLYVAFLQAAANRNATFAASSLYRRTIGRDGNRLAYPLRAQTSLATSATLLGETAGPAGPARRPAESPDAGG